MNMHQCHVIRTLPVMFGLNVYEVSLHLTFDTHLLYAQYELTLEQVMKAQRGSRGIALLFFNPSARWGWVVSAMPWPLYLQERETVPIVQEVGWASEPVWTDAKSTLCPVFLFRMILLLLL